MNWSAEPSSYCLRDICRRLILRRWETRNRKPKVSKPKVWVKRHFYLDISAHLCVMQTVFHDSVSIILYQILSGHWQQTMLCLCCNYPGNTGCWKWRFRCRVSTPALVWWREGHYKTFPADLAFSFKQCNCLRQAKVPSTTPTPHHLPGAAWGTQPGSHFNRGEDRGQYTITEPTAITCCGIRPLYNSGGPLLRHPGGPPVIRGSCGLDWSHRTTTASSPCACIISKWPNTGVWVHCR